MDEGKKFVARVDEKPEEDGKRAEQPGERAPTEDFRMPVAVYMED